MERLIDNVEPITQVNRVDAPRRAVPAPKPRATPPPSVPTGDGWMTTGECWQAIAPRMDISRRSFDRLTAQWRQTGQRPDRLAGVVVADLDARSRYPDKSNQARWLKVAQDGHSEE